jgi:alkanesulfonate monooxygenase SsuD/methylene tetrahydromethanopterin reductase-like flavin-dependent oxidoreductase (luciferase family)
VCDAVEGRFLNQSDLTALQAAATQSDQEGTFAVMVPDDSPLGEAVTLAAALSTATERTLLGVLANLEGPAHRHPTVLARDMTTLDLLSQGRALLIFAGPFTDATTEAATLCRDMWRNGVAASEGPHYPVAGAINRPAPFSAATPKIALDTTQGHTPPPDLLELADFLLLDRQADGCQIADA